MLHGDIESFIMHFEASVKYANTDIVMIFSEEKIFQKPFLRNFISWSLMKLIRTITRRDIVIAKVFPR